MKTHSHAPWKIAKRDNNLTYVVSADDKLVARAIPGDSVSVIANERLISGAPELLDAVISALNDALGGKKGYLPPSTIEKLNDAYKKAIGENFIGENFNG